MPAEGVKQEYTPSTPLYFYKESKLKQKEIYQILTPTFKVIFKIYYYIMNTKALNKFHNKIGRNFRTRSM
jgi:hypothetical protein